MKIGNLHWIVGFYLSISIFLAYTGNASLNVGMTLGFFGVIFLITLGIKKPLGKQKITESKLSFFYFFYVFLAIFSIFYFFDGDYLTWFLGVLPFIFTIYFFQNSIPHEYTFQQKKEVFRAFWSGAALGSLIILIFALFFGEIISLRLETAVFSSNTLARYTIVVIGYHISNLFLPKIKIRDVIIIFFAFLILLLTGSKTSLFAVLLIILYLLVSLRLLKFNILISIALIIVIFFLSPMFTSINKYLEGGQLNNLSGRENIWIPLIDLIKHNIWFGYGYNSPTNLLTIKYFDIWEGRDIIQAHNAFLQSLLNVGTIGTVVLLLLVFFQFKKISSLKYFDKNLYFLLYFLFGTLIIRGFTEASFTNGGGVEVFWFSIIILQSLFCINKEKYNTYLFN